MAEDTDSNSLTTKGLAILVSELQPFADRLDAAIRRRGTPTLVGLDPWTDLLPPGILPEGAGASWEARARAVVSFCLGVIDVVAPLVGVVKAQAAFFEQLGPTGMVALSEVIHYAQAKGLLVILDGKRNDIGSTATAYADGILGPQSAWGADALTVSPYLGDDSLRPFVDVAVERRAGVFILVKTSNPGGGMFQDLLVSAQPATSPQASTVAERPAATQALPAKELYRHVAGYVEQLAAQTVGSCGYGAVGAVVGATYPEQLAQLRTEMPHTRFLVPGFGSQGATARDVAGAFDSHGGGAIINNSRGILFAYRSKKYAGRFGPSHWQEAVEAATHEMIDHLRAETPAGKLVGG